MLIPFFFLCVTGIFLQFEILHTLLGFVIYLMYSKLHNLQLIHRQEEGLTAFTLWKHPYSLLLSLSHQVTSAYYFIAQVA
jgi:hypothetical protein